MRYVRLSALLLPALLWGPRAEAKKHQPAFLAPGFQFSQVDKVCVMPLIDARQSRPLPSPPLNLEPVRLRLMEFVQARGYHLADPGCSAGAGGGSIPPNRNARWLLTVRLDTALLFGSRIAASLFDAETDKEVWRDNTKPGWGSRFLAANFGNAPSDATFLTLDIYFLLAASFEKRKKAPLVGSGFEEWAPVSVHAQVFLPRGRYHFCGGTFQVNSGVASFKPDREEDQCREYEFSVPGNQIKSLGTNLHFGYAIPPPEAFHVTISGKGKMYFCSSKGADRLIMAMGGSR